MVTRVAGDTLDVGAVPDVVERPNNLQVKIKRRLGRSPGTIVCARTGMEEISALNSSLGPAIMVWTGYVEKDRVCACIFVQRSRARLSLRCASQMSTLIKIVLIVSTRICRSGCINEVFS